ncbi:MAG: adenosine deaminase [Planctomycetota bacterium]
MSQSDSAMSLDFVRELPKVLLHDHLDGGLRPSTIVELAREQGVEIPTQDPQELEQWFHRGANRGSLPLYLEGFRVTCGVMQTEAALRRVAREKAEDLARDGVVYAEVRFAPILHTEKGLNLEQVMNAVIQGLEEGCAGRNLRCAVIVCALRNMAPALSLVAAELAVDYRDRGAVGFDLAGDEAGHPPKQHIEAFQYLLRQNFSITIHAGEAFGLSSIWQAIQICGAHRVGHATRLYEDMVDRDGKMVKGPMAQYILDKRIPLEMCLSSNVHTGAVRSLEEHPFVRYLREGFRVTLNTDNTLMSATTLSDELYLAHRLYGLDLNDLQDVTMQSMKSAFVHFQERIDIMDKVIRPGYAAKGWRERPYYGPGHRS